MNDKTEVLSAELKVLSGFAFAMISIDAERTQHF